LELEVEQYSLVVAIQVVLLVEEGRILSSEEGKD
jgi:hypothetical protein